MFEGTIEVINFHWYDILLVAFLIGIFKGIGEWFNKLGGRFYLWGKMKVNAYRARRANRLGYRFWIQGGRLIVRKPTPDPEGE